MASTFKKYSPDAVTKTHGEVDASLVDLIMPHTELCGTMANAIRSTVYFGGGWIGRGVKEGLGFNPF